jgi:hypothetical protein
MTNLERLIQARVEQATFLTFSSVTEKIAEELAMEMLKDPQVRADLQALVRRAFAITMQQLQDPAAKEPPNL